MGDKAEGREARRREKGGEGGQFKGGMSQDVPQEILLRSESHLLSRFALKEERTIDLFYF